jgi:hypothetical protein
MGTRVLSLFVAVLALSAARIAGADTKIAVKDLPPAVRKAVAYEAVVLKDGKKSEVVVNAAGKPAKP